MNRSIQPIKKLLFLIAFLLLLALPACAGLAFSPEQAAMNAVRGNLDTNVSMVVNSLIVHQSVKARDDLYVVIMSFKQIRANSGDETCLYTYEIAKQGPIWGPNSGGGGCWTQNIVNGLPEDIQIGSSQSTSNQPGDAGFSQAYGLVTNPEIVKVKVNWDDGQQEELAVSESTFVSYRFGLFDMVSLEGLNEKGEVIYTSNPQVAPGKTP